MVQWLGELVASPENQTEVPNCLLPTAPGDLMTSSGPHRHCTYMHIHISTSIEINLEENKRNIMKIS